MKEMVENKAPKRAIFSIVAVLFMILISLIVSLRVVKNQFELISASSGVLPDQPFHSHAANSLALSLITQVDDVTNAKADAIIVKLLKTRPYWAPYYFQASWTQLRTNEVSKARANVKKAIEYWPTKGLLLAQSARVLAIVGEVELSRNVAKKAFWSMQVPADVPLSFLFSSDEIDLNLVDELLAYESKYINGKNIDYFPDLFRYAHRKRNMKILSRAINYANLDDHEKFLNMFATLSVSTPEPDEMQRVRSMLNLVDDGNLIVNPSFEEPLLNGSLGWKLGVYDNLVIKKDTRNSFDGEFSLRLRFNGNENLRIVHPMQYVVPKEGKKTYLLSGYWKGVGLTTRTLPTLRIYSVKDNVVRLLGYIDTRKRTWDWELFEIRINDDDISDFFLIRLERANSSDLDSKIDGDLWLDALTLKSTEDDGFL